MCKFMQLIHSMFSQVAKFYALNIKHEPTKTVILMSQANNESVSNTKHN